jgi:hypothetical protein|tara:strand:+ start:154 stop:465 length:312 start_codon:yes stop_codon:yes gene_type:complete
MIFTMGKTKKNKSRKYLSFHIIIFLLFLLISQKPIAIFAEFTPTFHFETKNSPEDYLDFSYLGFAIQIIIGSLAAVLFALRRYYSSIISRVKRSITKKKDSSD